MWYDKSKITNNNVTKIKLNSIYGRMGNKSKRLEMQFSNGHMKCTIDGVPVYKTECDLATFGKLVSRIGVLSSEYADTDSVQNDSENKQAEWHKYTKNDVLGVKEAIESMCQMDKAYSRALDFMYNRFVKTETID